LKLLFCWNCQDIFKLDLEPRECKCGLVTGKYIDNRHAITNGKGISIAIGNGALEDAIRKSIADSKYPGAGSKQVDERKYHSKLGNIKHAWVRPNEGPGNPHQKVVKEE
jgi:hypothetical protein